MKENKKDVVAIMAAIIFAGQSTTKANADGALAAALDIYNKAHASLDAKHK
jgi:hypothetical protein